MIEVQHIVDIIASLINQKTSIDEPYTRTWTKYEYDITNAHLFPLARMCLAQKIEKIDFLITSTDMFYSMNVLATYKLTWLIKDVLKHLVENKIYVDHVYIGLSIIGDDITLAELKSYMRICQPFYHKYVLKHILETAHDQQVIQYCINNGADIQLGFLNAFLRLNHIKILQLINSTSPDRERVINRAMISYIAHSKSIMQAYTLTDVKRFVDYGNKVSVSCIDVYFAFRIAWDRKATALIHYFLGLIKNKLGVSCDEETDQLILNGICRYYPLYE